MNVHLVILGLFSYVVFTFLKRDCESCMWHGHV